MSLYNIFLLSFVEIFGDFQLEKYANFPSVHLDMVV